MNGRAQPPVFPGRNFRTVALKTNLIVLASCFLLTLFMLIWGMNRGFDITDEGAYLLGYRYPEENLIALSSADLILGKVFGVLSPGIVGYRLVRLALTLLASVVFAWGLVRWLNAVQSSPHAAGLDFPAVYLFLSLGNFLSYSFGPQSISYNSLTNALILTGAGLILFLLSVEDARKSQSAAVPRVCFIIGILIGLLFFIKFPSSLSFFGVSVVAFAVKFRSRGGRYLAMILAYLGGGVCASAGVFFVAFQDVTIWYSNFMSALTAFPEWSHNPNLLMRQYLLHLWGAGRDLIWRYGIVLVGVAVFVRLAWGGQTEKRAHGLQYGHCLMLIGLGLVFLYQSYSLLVVSHLLTFTALVMCAVLLIQVIVAVELSWGMKKYSPERWVTTGTWVGGCFLLGVLPMVGAVGTNNLLLMKAVDFITPWFALALALVLHIALNVNLKHMVPVFVCGMALFAQSLTVYGYTYAPYRLQDNLIHQTESVGGLDNLQGVQVDAATKDFVEKLNTMIRKHSKLQAGDPILALYDMPGLVYLLGGRSPGSSWYAGAPEEQRRNCAKLSAGTHSDLNKAILLLSQDIAPVYLACMRDAGLSYPKGYAYLGGVKSPYSKKMVHVWAPTPRDPILSRNP